MGLKNDPVYVVSVSFPVRLRNGTIKRTRKYPKLNFITLKGKTLSFDYHILRIAHNVFHLSVPWKVLKKGFIVKGNLLGTVIYNRYEPIKESVV